MSRLLRYVAAGLLLILPQGAALADSSATVTVSGTQSDTVATFSGYSSPNSFMTILDNGSVVGTTSAAPDGTFMKSLTNQDAGSHTFGFESTNGAGLTTLEFDLIVTLQPHTETLVSNIIMPSTITQGAGLHPEFQGMGAPNSQVTFFVNGSPLAETETTAPDGTWSHSIATPLAQIGRAHV